MKRLLTIFLVLSFAVASFAQRVTDIITSINSNTSEAVTVSTAWTGTDGDLVLSASVPASVKVGDTITDSGGNTYLITGISGSNLTSQDFDTTTDPATGSATIQEAYATLTLWEADLDVTALYASSDDAVGEIYDNGAFDETVTVNGGGTVGLNSVKLTVPTAERHDGTAGTGARIVATAARFISLATPSGFDNKYTLEWFEIDGAGNNGPLLFSTGSNFTDVPIFKNLIIHDADGGNSLNGLLNANNRDALVMNSVFYDNSRNSSGTIVEGLNLDGDRTSGGAFNNTIYNISNAGAGGASGMKVNTNSANHSNKNNISVGTTSAGTALDFDYAGTTIVDDFNMSEDASADDGGGSNHVISVTLANQFVSTAGGGSEDLHIQDADSDSFEAGTDLGTSPTNVNFDIDNFNRNAGATIWSIGAHDGNNFRGSVRRRIPSRVF